MKILLLGFLFVITPALWAGDARTISWDDLLPEGEIELLEKMLRESNQRPLIGHSANPDWDFVPQQFGTFNTVEELDGKLVRLPGFVLPLEYGQSGQVKDFLLVPYMGACIHEPPPPPNQIVFVESAEPEQLSEMWKPVWVTGILKAEKILNNLGNTAYMLDLKGWEPYED